MPRMDQNRPKPGCRTGLQLSTLAIVESSSVLPDIGGRPMRVSILLQITGDDGAIGPAEEVTAFHKATERPEDLGLSIAEGKRCWQLSRPGRFWLKQQRGRSDVGAAPPAASAGTARAATRLCSVPCMAMSNWTVRACTAARARTRMVRPQCRHFGT